MLLGVILAATVGSATPTLDRLKFREHQYTQGTLHKDAGLLARVFAPKFIDTTTTGAVIDKKEYLANLADPTWSLTRIDVSNERYILAGGTAIVSAEFKMVGQENGKPISQHGRATDVWVWQNGDWWCIAAHSSAIPKK